MRADNKSSFATLCVLCVFITTTHFLEGMASIGLSLVYSILHLDFRKLTDTFACLEIKIPQNVLYLSCLRLSNHSTLKQMNSSTFDVYVRNALKDKRNTLFISMESSKLVATVRDYYENILYKCSMKANTGE